MVGSLGTIGISLFAPFASLETSIFGYEADHFVKEIMQDYAYFINWLSIPNFSGGLSFLNMFLFYLFIFTASLYIYIYIWLNSNYTLYNFKQYYTTE